MALHWLTIVLIVTAVFAVIELGLTAYIASVWNGGMWIGSPPVVNFMIFNSIWSLLVLAYIGLVPMYMANLFHKMVALGLNVITTIFWFAGAIALAVAVGGPRTCGADTYCGSLEAAVAFAFFIWVLFTVITVVDAREALRRRGPTTAAV